MFIDFWCKITISEKTLKKKKKKNSATLFWHKPISLITQKLLEPKLSEKNTILTG